MAGDSAHIALASLCFSNARVSTFSWTPGFDVAGAEQAVPIRITITATDAHDGEASASVVLVVLNTNREPTIEAISTQTVTEGQVFEFDVPASDPDGDPLRLRVDPLPDDAGVDGLTFVWPTKQADVGEHEFQLVLHPREREPRVWEVAGG